MLLVDDVDYQQYLFIVIMALPRHSHWQHCPFNTTRRGTMTCIAKCRFRISSPSVCTTSIYHRPLSTNSSSGKSLISSSSRPADGYQLLPTSAKAGPSEDALFQQEVEDVKSWWAKPRFKGIKRSYTAEQVVSKRGALQQEYPSSLMARKLFNLLQERAAAGEPVQTSTLDRL